MRILRKVDFDFAREYRIQEQNQQVFAQESRAERRSARDGATIGDFLQAAWSKPTGYVGSVPGIIRTADANVRPRGRVVPSSTGWSLDTDRIVCQSQAEWLWMQVGFVTRFRPAGLCDRAGRARITAALGGFRAAAWSTTMFNRRREFGETDFRFILSSQTREER